MPNDSIGQSVITRAGLVQAAGGVAITGRVLDLATLGARASSLRVVLAVQATLDAGDSLSVADIAVQSAIDVGFTTPIARGTASTLTLTGATGQTQAKHFGQVAIDLDLTVLPVDHRYLRFACRPTLSDPANSVGAVGAVFIFGGTDRAPIA
jgi:hypothetical protein